MQERVLRAGHADGVDHVLVTDGACAADLGRDVRPCRVPIGRGNAGDARVRHWQDAGHLDVQDGAGHTDVEEQTACSCALLPAHLSELVSLPTLHVLETVNQFLNRILW